MKRSILLGIVLALCTLFIASAAFGQAFTQVWSVSPGTWPILTSGDASRGAALDVATGHYLVTRKDLTRIYVFNASTGALLDSLNMTGVSGGTYPITDLEVTSDGVIYTMNLTLGPATDTTVKIYRWADDNNATVPTVAFSGRVSLKAAGPRLGDAFNVAGSGTGTVIYVGGNAATTDTVQVFTTTDGINFTRTGGIPITGNYAGAGIAQVTPGGNFYTSWFSGGNPVRLISTAGTVVSSLPTTVIPAAQADIAYLEAGGRKWLAVCDSVSSPGHAGAALINVTYGIGAGSLVGKTPRMGNAANTNASSDVAMKYDPADSTITMYVLIDNNGIAAFKTGNLLAKSLSPLISGVSRSIYIPQAGVADSVSATIMEDDGVAVGGARVLYSINGGADVIATMARTSGDSLNGTYVGVIPGSANTDGARISYKVQAIDIDADTSTTAATPGYFAGITKLSITGPRAVDTTTGVLLYKGYAVRVQAVCTMEDSVTYNYQLDVNVQDDKGGADIFQSSALGGISKNFVRGNQYTIEGTIDQYNGKLEIATVAGKPALVITDNGPGALPAPAVVTMHDLAWGLKGELLEGSVVRIAHVTLTPSSLPWPGAGASGTNITLTDNNGVDSITLRVPAWTDLNGMSVRQPFTLTGVANQFDGSSPYTAGYQVIARYHNDVSAEVAMSLPETTSVAVNKQATLALAAVDSLDGLNITSYQFTVVYDTTKLTFAGTSIAGTLSAGFTVASNNGNIAGAGATALTGNGTLLNIKFTPRDTGSTIVTITGQFNEAGAVPAMVSGRIVVTPVLAQLLAIDNKRFRTSVTNVGHFGALTDFQTPLPSFFVNNAERLFEGSLIFATDKGHVSTAERSSSGAWSLGLHPLDDIHAVIAGSKTTTTTTYDDANQTHPMGIQVSQWTVSDTAIGKNGYMLVGLDVVNKSGATLTGLSVGSMFDFDLTSAGNTDHGVFVKDSLNTIASVNGGAAFKFDVLYQTHDSTYVGIVPLSQSVVKSGRIGINPNEVYKSGLPFSDSLKYLYLTTPRPGPSTYTDGGAANDLSIFSGVGPYTLNAGDTAHAAFAVVTGTGTNAAALVASARAAQAAYAAMGKSISILTDVKEVASTIPTNFNLSQNFPNPFNPSTTIKFELPMNANVSLKIYDMLGREVRTLVNSDVEAGFHQVVWDGRTNLGVQVSSGMYLYRISAGSFVATKKMMLLK